MAAPQWVAIQRQQPISIETNRPALGVLWKHGGKRTFFWGGSSARFTASDPAALTVLKSYGPAEWFSGHESDGFVDRLDLRIAFAGDFPLASTDSFSYATRWNPSKGKMLPAVFGWLSPEGLFYAHTEGQENDTAEHLCLQVYGIKGGLEDLFARGWGNIAYNGIISWADLPSKDKPDRITPRQLAFHQGMLAELGRELARLQAADPASLEAEEPCVIESLSEALRYLGWTVEMVQGAV